MLPSGLCFMGTCRLLGAAPAPSHPSKSPVKTEQSCSSLKDAPRGKGGWEEKGETPCEIKVSKRSFKRGKLQPCTDVVQRVQSLFHGEHLPGQVSVEQLSSSFSPSASHQAAFVNALFSIPYPFAAMLSGTCEEETWRWHSYTSIICHVPGCGRNTTGERHTGFCLKPHSSCPGPLQPSHLNLLLALDHSSFNPQGSAVDTSMCTNLQHVFLLVSLPPPA